MFYLITIILTVIIGIGTNWDGSQYFLLIIGLLISIITQLAHYYSHVEDIEDIKMCKKDIDIYKNQADEILGEIKMYVLEKYPDHELKIFEKISAQTVDIIAVKFPELKSDGIFKKYINSLINMRSEIYDLKTNITNAEKKLKVRERTIKLFVLPILPKNN
jgi:hypothetical protein